MSVAHLKTSEKMSVKAIGWLYHGYLTFSQAFQAHGDILIMNIK